MRRFKRTTTNSLQGRHTNRRGEPVCSPSTEGRHVGQPLKRKADWKSALQKLGKHVCLLLLILTFTITALFAQTVTLFETDFEAADHGWTMANGTQTNQWHVGTATHAPGGGSRSAYISNDGGVSNVYTSTSRSLVHMYRVISLPEGATDIVLTFDAKCNRV